ncbi:protein kinase [Streptomyces sp. NPDC048518]|uniref:serine/threonine-protein kinase n=1 Tax=Streptomyces sp. NPDC048518 TaxID=3155029 RepID=UPI0033D79097
MHSGDQEQTDGVGRLLAGRYRVVAQLGRGGMGVVWRAVDEVLHREVAVKELRTYTDAAGPELADLRLRMQREARAAARVRHAGVVAVHDVTEVDGRPLIVMELVDGPSLDDVLRDRGTLDPREAAAIGAKVMEALAAAHRVGVLHRDVKPGNILLEAGGRVVLTDFGIATMDDPGDGSATHLTRSGELVGSLDYLAPERAQGHDPGPASDVWALGATLYAAVEGASPFRRTSTWSTLTAIVADPLPEPRRAGPLTPVLQQLMHKDPQTRPDADAAGRLLAGVASAAAPYVTTERSIPSAPPPGFGPPLAGAGAGTGAGTGAGYGQGLPGSGQMASPAPQAPEPYVQHVQHQMSAGPAPASASPSRAETRATRNRPRRSRAVPVAVAVAVVLAATGVTVAVLNAKEDGGSQARQDAAAPGRAGSSDDDDSRGPLGGGSKRPKPSQQGDGKSRKPDGKHADDAKDAADKDSSGAEKGEDGRKGKGKDGDTSGARPDPTSKPTKGGSGGPSGGGDSAPAPVCHPAGGGKYNCDVWRTAPSYTAGGAQVGTLNKGANYFYCQQNLGRRETYGRWTNVWWAKTDDDSGNTNVFVSDVYLKGGDNDKPLPGLPTC